MQKMNGIIVALFFLCIVILISPANCTWFSVVEFTQDLLGIERCPDDDDKILDIELLSKELNEKVFGQGIIIKALIIYLKNHYASKPKKPLVISMHGWTGIGKNYVTSIVVKSLFKEGGNSKFVHMFSGRIHFPREEKQYISEYKSNLQNWIKGNVTKCGRSMFIFDEIDKMPDGILDAIKPFLDYHEKVDGVDFRKATFVFISNIGGGIINQEFKYLWGQGMTKDKISYDAFENKLRKSLYNSEGGLKQSSILEGNLVSLFLPFLPLDLQDIQKCIETEMVQKNIVVNQEGIEEILKKVDFIDGFAVSGCKRISELVSILRYKRIEL